MDVFSEAKAGFGKAAEPEPETSGGVVPEQEGKVRKFSSESRVLLVFHGRACSTLSLNVVHKGCYGLFNVIKRASVL